MNRQASVEQLRITDNIRYTNIYLEGLQRCLEDLVTLTPDGEAKRALLEANRHLYEVASKIEFWKHSM